MLGTKLSNLLLAWLWLACEVSCQLPPNPAYWAQPEWIANIDSSEHGTFKGKKSTTCPCGWTNKDDGRIVGGRETVINEYPYMVALARRNERGNLAIFCGGAIVSPYHVITAAHCLAKKDPLSVIVGEHNLDDAFESKYTEIHPVEKAISHEGYDAWEYENDIAILVVKSKIKFNQRVGAVCLPKEPQPMLHEYVKVTGWGNTKYKGDMSSALLKVNLRVIPLPDCAARYWNTRINITEPTQFCTYGLGKDACQGDSGGPLVWLDPTTNRYTLVGVVSYGWACAKTTPGVNTDIHAYLDWIHYTMRRNSPENVSVCTRKD